jgi:hypothetical protein
MIIPERFMPLARRWQERATMLALAGHSMILEDVEEIEGKSRGMRMMAERFGKARRPSAFGWSRMEVQEDVARVRRDQSTDRAGNGRMVEAMTT